jgi:hypothetical protein
MLPKDVRALRARQGGRPPHADHQAILGSNLLQIRAIDEIVETGKKKWGCSASASRPAPTTCAARSSSSPRHSGKGYQPASTTRTSRWRVVGTNKEPSTRDPHLSSLLTDTIDEVLDKSEVIVVDNAAPELATLTRTRPDQIILDLVIKTEERRFPRLSGIAG